MYLGMRGMMPGFGGHGMDQMMMQVGDPAAAAAGGTGGGGGPGPAAAAYPGFGGGGGQISWGGVNSMPAFSATTGSGGGIGGGGGGGSFGGGGMEGFQNKMFGGFPSMNSYYYQQMAEMVRNIFLSTYNRITIKCAELGHPSFAKKNAQSRHQR